MGNLTKVNIQRQQEGLVLDQPCFDGYPNVHANVHAIPQIPTETIPNSSRARFEIDSNTVKQQSQSTH